MQQLYSVFCAFFWQWPIPILALDSHGPNQKLPFPDVKKGPSSILQHDSPHKLREVNQYQLLQLENCHCSSFFSSFLLRVSMIGDTHKQRERERERDWWRKMFHWRERFLITCNTLVWGQWWLHEDGQETTHKNDVLCHWTKCGRTK